MAQRFFVDLCKDCGGKLPGEHEQRTITSRMYICAGCGKETETVPTLVTSNEVVDLLVWMNGKGHGKTESNG